MTDTTEIVPSIPLDRLLAQRNAALAQLERIRDASNEYKAIGDAIFPESSGVGYRFYHPVSGGRWESTAIGSDEWLAKATKELDASLWAHLFEQSGLRTFLDAKARAEWDEQIDKHQTPPLTVENIAATFKALYASRGDMFERGVVNLFSGLSWDYKTNKPVRFGKRLILTHVRDSYGFTRQHNTDKLDDLVRAFCVLDHKPEPDHRTGAWHHLGMGGMNSPPPTWDAEYFTIKCFKNGNGHLTFKRPNLVDQLNRILAKHRPDALPPADGHEHAGAIVRRETSTGEDVRTEIERLRAENARLTTGRWA